MFLKQKGLEMSFKEREGGTVRRDGGREFQSFGGHGAESPATQGRQSGVGDREGIVVR